MNRVVFSIIIMTLGQSVSAQPNKPGTATTYRPIAHSISQNIRNDFEQIRACQRLYKWTPQIGNLYGQLNAQLYSAREQLSIFVKQNGYTDLTDDQAKQIQTTLAAFQQNLDRTKTQLSTTPTSTPASHQP